MSLYVLAFLKMPYIDVVIQFLCKTFDDLCWIWPDIAWNEKFRHNVALGVNLIGDCFQNSGATNAICWHYLEDPQDNHS